MFYLTAYFVTSLSGLGVKSLYMTRFGYQGSSTSEKGRPYTKH